MAKAQTRATQKYKSQNYKRIPLEVRFDDYEIIKSAAQKNGESVNGFIKRSIFNQIEREEER